MRYCIDNNKVFAALSLDEFKQFSPLFEEDARQITTTISLAARNTYGGTAPAQVQAALTATLPLLDEPGVGWTRWLSRVPNGNTTSNGC